MLSILITIGNLIPSLFGKTLSTKAAKVVGIALIAAVLVSSAVLLKCAYDASVINEHEVEREAKAGEAREDAADQRLSDLTNNARSEEELIHAIEAAPVTPAGLNPAALALSCERLRRIGRVPAACRSGGSD